MRNNVTKPSVIIIMGIAGAGKTTIGKLLAAQLSWKFEDADSFHSNVNIQKMSEGIALSDNDRVPWLRSMRNAITLWITHKEPTVLACSALKMNYRDSLQVDSHQVRIVYLKASLELLSQRLQERKGHFLKAKMLESQFLALEEPADALSIDASRLPKDIVDEICRIFKL